MALVVIFILFLSVVFFADDIYAFIVRLNIAPADILLNIFFDFGVEFDITFNVSVFFDLNNSDSLLVLSLGTIVVCSRLIELNIKEYGLKRAKFSKLTVYRE